MLQYLIELIMFLMPGVLAELVYCVLARRTPPVWMRVVRALALSTVPLALRTVFSVAGGWKDGELRMLFHGIGNYLHYFIISIFVILTMPPLLVTLEKAMKTLLDREDGIDKNE